MNIRATDPYGNGVIIPKKLIPDTLLGTDLMETIDRPDKVIEKPAIMLTTCDEGPIERCGGPCINHYFRLIGPDTTLLISAEREGTNWLAFRCIENPTTKELESIFQNTRTP
jgi:hypothetical protein